MDEQLFILQCRLPSNCMPASKIPEATVDRTWYNMLVSFAVSGFICHGFSLMMRVACRCRTQVIFQAECS